MQHYYKPNKASKFFLRVFYEFLRSNFGLSLLIIYNIRFVNRKIFRKLKPPFMVLANHVNLFDPFIVNVGIPQPVHWVASDANFRSPFLGSLFRALGVIPKTKNMSDIETIKIMHDFTKNKEVTGLFPEGSQSWDGRNNPVFPATAKLLRFLKIPIVFAQSKGSFISRPRWAWSTRRGKVEVEYKILFSAEELRTLKLSEIEKRLIDAFTFDDFEYQEKRKVIYKSSKRAEYIENILYTCPSCKEIGTIRSKGNNATCSNCGFTFSVNQYGFLEFPSDQKTPVKSYAAWNDWQRKYWKTTFSKNRDGLLVQDDDIVLFKSKYRSPLEQISKGTLCLYKDRLELVPKKGDPLVFDFESVRGLNVFKQQHLEFYFDKTAYRCEFPQKWISGYKWAELYRIIMDLEGKEVL